MLSKGEFFNFFFNHFFTPSGCSWDIKCLSSVSVCGQKESRIEFVTKDGQPLPIAHGGAQGALHKPLGVTATRPSGGRSTLVSSFMWMLAVW